MNFNLPIEIGQKFRKMIIENFRSIDYAYRNLSDVIYKHKSLDKHAHDASQIDYANTSVDKHLNYQNKRIKNVDKQIKSGNLGGSTISLPKLASDSFGSVLVNE